MKAGSAGLVLGMAVEVNVFTCGAALGNQMRITGIVGAFETGACPLV